LISLGQRDEPSNNDGAGIFTLPQPLQIPDGYWITNLYFSVFLQFILQTPSPVFNPNGNIDIVHGTVLDATRGDGLNVTAEGWYPMFLVTENKELAQATQSQTTHSNQFNVNGTVTGNYGPVTATVSTSFGSQDQNSNRGADHFQFELHTRLTF
jgi:hypothetical protein